jgi:hypothetical protein
MRIGDDDIEWHWATLAFIVLVIAWLIVIATLYRV